MHARLLSTREELRTTWIAKLYSFDTMNADE